MTDVPDNATPRAIQISSWSRPVVVATVCAYRRSMGEQDRAPIADKAAVAAFIAAGGDPARAAEDVPAIIAAATQEHGTWFWRPARERLERQERAWKARGIWPSSLGARGGPDNK
jgi:hypothetical protein